MKKLVPIVKPKEFYPDFLSLFYNSSFLSRMALLKSITKHAHEMSGKLLDFGSGSKPYRAIFSVDEYIGVDIAESGHSHNDSLIDFYYDGERLPFESEYFDSFFSSEVFEHVFNLPDILKEVHRVLKPGGKILITIPFAIHEHETPFDFARYTSFGIQDLLASNGFEIIKIEKTNHYLEAIFQLQAWYNASLIYKKFKLLTFAQLLVLVAPVNIMGCILSRLLPKRDTFYSNLIVLAKRV